MLMTSKTIVRFKGKMGRKKLEMTLEARKAHDRKLAADRQRRKRAKMTEADKKNMKVTRRNQKKKYLSQPGKLAKQREYERKSRKRSRIALNALRSASVPDKL